jgi:hypothetical protein
MLMNETMLDNDQASFPEVIPERRRSPRSHPTQVRARLAWRTDGLRVRKVPAELIDISETGARVSTHSSPQHGLSFFWVGLRSLPCEWVKASIQEVVRQDLDWVYRLRFLEDCAPGIIEFACAKKT